MGCVATPQLDISSGKPSRFCLLNNLFLCVLVIQIGPSSVCCQRVSERVE